MTKSEITKLEALSDTQLHDLLRKDTVFTEAVILGLPDLAADNAFDLYGKEWIQRYWKRLVVEVNGSLTSGSVLGWAAGATAGALTTLIAKRFNIPEVAIPAATALAILILRTARGQKAPSPPLSGQETEPDSEKT